MKDISLALVGFGNVGKALARILLRKRELLEREYGLRFKVTGIATARHGMAINIDGIDLEQTLALLEAGEAVDSLSVCAAPPSVLEFIQVCPADVLFENTPVNHHTGQPAIDYLSAALKEGMHVITANKGPVVHGYRQLTELAAAQGKRFMYESTVMDGAPIFSLFRCALPAMELRGFRGILNSCTNLLLERMEQGEPFDQAVAYAQSIGIAETDPSADIDGWDAAIKVAALVSVLMGIPTLPQQVDREGIGSLTPEMIAEAKQAGERWKLVCSALREGNQVLCRVAPQRASALSPLYSISGTSSYVQFESDVLPGLGIVESNPGPETTAYGLLADLINVYRENSANQ
ncbi:MAG: homoserine dehydrogenase [Anaerolineaceae bacterium]|nr:homoserine dehydrogenase [Anaerolineaceae bacterium]